MGLIKNIVLIIFILAIFSCSVFERTEKNIIIYDTIRIVGPGKIEYIDTLPDIKVKPFISRFDTIIKRIYENKIYKTDTIRIIYRFPENEFIYNKSSTDTIKKVKHIQKKTESKWWEIDWNFNKIMMFVAFVIISIIVITLIRLFKG